MRPDEKDFLYPVIDNSKCIMCGMCERICPIVSPRNVRNSMPRKSYAC